MPNYKFIDGIEELYQSIYEFNKEEIYYRELIGNSPKYFVYFKSDNKIYFGLSKFCAFKNITVESYIREFRYKTDGGKTQKHITKLADCNWLSFSKIPTEIQRYFQSWIKPFFPNYNISKASFIALNPSKENHKKNIISQDDLDIILEQKKNIGQIGETIALNFEKNRLRALGCANPDAYVVQTSLSDVNAGYDLFSDFDKKTRMIEVKTNSSDFGDIFITKNELANFSSNPDKAFLYIVRIKDIKKGIGEVIKQIDDIDDLGALEPIIFKVRK